MILCGPRVATQRFHGEPQKKTLRTSTVTLPIVFTASSAARSGLDSKDLMMKPNNCYLTITRVREQARNVRSFDLAPECNPSTAPVQFIPGQVAVLRVGDEDPAYFAFASAPEDAELEFLVKRTIGASVG